MHFTIRPSRRIPMQLVAKQTANLISMKLAHNKQHAIGAADVIMSLWLGSDMLIDSCLRCAMANQQRIVYSKQSLARDQSTRNKPTSKVELQTTVKLSNLRRE